MKKTGIVSLFFGLVLIVSSCKPEGKPIDYGHDKCDYCMMTIVDQRFGCEVVTKKGKVYKFDAVECMVNYVSEKVEDENGLALLFTNTHDHPGKFIDAHSAKYLVSKNMPSPMGMYINPFGDAAEAQKMQQQNGGEIFSWDELRAKFAN